MKITAVKLILIDELSGKIKSIEERFKKLSNTIQKGTKEGERGFKKLQSVVKGIGKDVDDLTGIFANLKTAVAGLLGGFSLTQAVKQGLEFQDVMERAKLSIASAVLLTSEIYENGKKITDVSKKWAIALKEAEELTKRLQKYNLETTAQFQEILEQFSIVLPYVRSVGASFEQAVDLTYLLTQAVKSLGLPMYQVGQEARALTQVIQLQNSQIAQTLGLKREELLKWKQQGILVQKLIERLKVYELAGKEVNNTLEGALSNLKDGLDYVLGAGFKPFYKYVISTIQKIQESLFTIKNGLPEPNPEFVSFLNKVSEKLIIASETAKQLATALIIAFKDETVQKVAILIAKITALSFAFKTLSTVAITTFRLIRNRIVLAVAGFTLLNEAINNTKLTIDALKGIFWKFAEEVNTIFYKLTANIIKLLSKISPEKTLKLIPLLNFLKENIEEARKNWETKGKKDLKEFGKKVLNDTLAVFDKLESYLDKKIKKPDLSKYFKDENKEIEAKANYTIKAKLKTQIDEKKLKEIEKAHKKYAQLWVELQKNQKIELAYEFSQKIDKLKEIKPYISKEEYENALNKLINLYKEKVKELEKEQLFKNVEKEITALESKLKVFDYIKNKLERLRATKEILIQELSRYSFLLTKVKRNSDEYYSILNKIYEINSKILDIEKQLKEESLSWTEAFKKGLTDIKIKGQEVAQTLGQKIRESLENVISSGIFDILTGKFKSLGDYIKSFYNMIMQELARVIAKMLVMKAVNFTVGKFEFGGEVQKFATGGFVKAQTGTYLSGGTFGKDSIPVLAQAGEYVVRRQAVQKFGKSFFDKLNNLSFPELATTNQQIINNTVNNQQIIKQEHKTVNINMNIQTLNPVEFEQYIRETGVIQKVVLEDAEKNGVIIRNFRTYLR